MQDMPQTKDGVVDRIGEATARFDSALGVLSDEELLAPGAGGAWSRRDVLAHIYADTRWFWGQLRAMLEERSPEPGECYGDYTPPGDRFDMSTVDGRNAFSIERTKGMSLGEVRAGLTEYRGRLHELVERVPEKEFGVLYTIVEHGDIGWVRRAVEGEEGFPPSPLWRWVAGATWHHYEEHLPDLEGAGGQSS